MNESMQQRWDDIRLPLLEELADTVRQLEKDEDLHPLILSFVEACAQAYDRDPPSYTVYNRLRSFMAGQWPLLRGLLTRLDDLPRTEATLSQATAWLTRANERRDDEGDDALEVQLRVLERLLAET
ncbi:MAG: hypothetical protein AAFU65_00540 [Pseudomonadota bacterium]